ncbi:UNKNOWN [Stylonychia lemnae]|uniref:Transmembrane protein n=1 Tax=Stylonychia lemnae TaxID=5949 RepID=A0A077ZUF8_STYLE|nr:UNKNOWN [Stylonychia lemnae]|eukprot:CDW73538.1 UNKNOWN [Stylonychia lemnae]
MYPFHLILDYLTQTINKIRNKKTKCNKFQKEFRSLDWFGQTVSLTYKGDDTYKTNFGAAISFILIVILSGFAGYKGAVLINQSSPEATKTSLIQDLKNAEIIAYGINEFSCLTDHDYELQGGYFDDNYKYIELKLFKCRNLTGNESCYSPEQIDNYFQDEKLNFAFTNTYLDYKDTQVKSKVKFFIDDSFYIELESQKTKKSNFYIQRQEASYQDDYIQFGQERTEQFFQVQNIHRFDDNYSNKIGQIAAIYFRFDNRYDLFSVKNYSLLDFLGDIGGLYGSLCGIGFAFVGFFCSRMFTSDILKKIYQIRKDPIQKAQSEQKGGFLANIKRRFTLRDHHQEEMHKKLSPKSKTEFENIFSQQNQLISFRRKSDQTSFKIQVLKAQTIDNSETPLKHLQNQNQIQVNHNLNIDNSNYSQISINQNQNTQSIRAKKIKSVHKREDSVLSNLTLPQLRIIKSDNQNIIDAKLKPSLFSSGNSLMSRIKQTITQKVREQMIAVELREKQSLEEVDIDNVLLAFIHRTRFVYGIKRMIEYVVKCLCFKRKQWLRKNKQGKVHYLYNKAEKKLKSELDVIQLLKSLRKFKLLQQAILPQKSRMLLQFQRFNLIETESSSSDSDDEKMQTVHLMENKNPFIRLLMYGKVKNMISQFQDKQLEPLELNLLRGVFQRRLKDFSEKVKEIKENKLLMQRVHIQLASVSSPKHFELSEQDAFAMAYEDGLLNETRQIRESITSFNDNKLKLRVETIDQENGRIQEYNSINIGVSLNESQIANFQTQDQQNKNSIQDKRKDSRFNNEFDYDDSLL